MSDQISNPLSRVFKIGAARIVETEAMSGLSSDQVRELLKTSYPEVANATVRERDENGLRVVEFLPQPGRKG
ncbi:MAG: hypothetical protein WA009_12945 [Phototrophicaceae bacterium]